MGVGVPELLIVLLVLVLLFGASRLPKLARALGESVRALRDGTGNDPEAPRP